MVYCLAGSRLRAHQRVGLFVIDSGHLHRFAAEKVRMSTNIRRVQLILLVNVTVPAKTPPIHTRALRNIDACRAEVYSQASGGRSLRGGLPAAMLP
jgi:hypothetical protein